VVPQVELPLVELAVLVELVPAEPVALALVLVA